MPMSFSSAWLSAAAIPAAIAVAFGTLPLSANERLPVKTDIPADYGGVAICASEGKALELLRNYHVASTYGSLDSSRYLAGLRATGCGPTDTPLQIVQVIERRNVGNDSDGPFMAFRARTASGAMVTGVVGEGGNNRHARTDFERWLRLHAPDGSVSISGKRIGGYGCPTLDAAKAAVRAIPPVARRGQNNPQQVAAFAQARKKFGCVPVSGRFRVNAVHANAFISVGYEAGQDWTALTATDAAGRRRFLIYDASLM
jgi:hypothetical protein